MKTQIAFSQQKQEIIMQLDNIRRNAEILHKKRKNMAGQLSGVQILCQIFNEPIFINLCR
jgi:hypothetical protein